MTKTDKIHQDTQDAEIKTLSFEDALKALEETVEALDRGTVPLDESIALYQRGAALRAHCEAKLKDAELKIAKITKDDDGNAKGAVRADDLAD